MAGVRLGGRIPSGYFIPFVLYDEDTSPQFGTAVWGVTTTPGQDLTRLSTRGDSLTVVDYMDPEPSPDRSRIIFSTTPIAAGASTVAVMDASSPPNSISVCATQTSALTTSMQPWWHPTQDLICYRNTDNSPNESSIRTCDPAVGAPSETVLITKSRTTVGTIFYPRFSPSGNYIAYMLDSAADANTYLFVMDADGTNDTQIKNMGTPAPQTGYEFAWMNGSDVIGYQHSTGGNMLIRKINADGTGDTLLFTDSNPFWGLTKRPWKPDDSAMIYFVRDLGSDPRFRLYSVDASGGGGAALSPNRTSYGDTARDLAFIYSSRIYWQEEDNSVVGNDNNVITSCALDGSDKREEFACNPPPAGFTSISWIGGFEGRL